MSINKSLTGLILSIPVMFAVITGCTMIAKKDSNEPTITRVWPEKPAKARIAYVKSFTSPDDLGISKGFFTQILDFFTGGSDWQLVRPMAIVASADGKIFVADPGSKAVHLFDTKNAEHKLILARDNQPFPSPTGLALGLKGEVYITDSSLGQVFVLHTGKDAAEALNLKINPDQPTNIAVDKTSKRLYIVDSVHHHIKVYDHNGTLIKTIGQRGNADGEFNFPSMIWIDDTGHLLVSDALNFRVQIFDLEGRFISKFGRLGDGTGDMSRPKGVAKDSHGHIYVVDALHHSIQLFNNSGEFLLNVGRRGNAAGEFLLPTGIYISHDNMIYVADSHNSRIQMFRYIGDRP